MRNLHAGWTMAEVGYHWSRGPFTISTFSMGRVHGYALYYNQRRFDHQTFKEAEEHARKIWTLLF